MILSYLDHIDLTVCQEVCRRWRTIATDSKLWSDLNRRIFKIGDFKRLNLKGHKYNIECYHLGGKLLATFSVDRLIKIWDLNEYKCIKTIDSPMIINFMSFAGDYLVATTKEPSTRLQKK